MKIRQTAIPALTTIACLVSTVSAQSQARNAPPRDEVRVEVADSVDFYRASDLIGRRVAGSGRESLGVIGDLLLDPRTYEIRYLILDPDSTVNLGGQRPIIPWVLAESVVSGNDSYFMLPLTADRLRTAPLFNAADAQLTRSAAWVGQVDAFYDADLRQRRVGRPDLEADPRVRGRAGFNNVGATNADGTVTDPSGAAAANPDGAASDPNQPAAPAVQPGFAGPGRDLPGPNRSGNLERGRGTQPGRDLPGPNRPGNIDGNQPTNPTAPLPGPNKPPGTGRSTAPGANRPGPNQSAPPANTTPGANQQSGTP